MLTNANKGGKGAWPSGNNLAAQFFNSSKNSYYWTYPKKEMALNCLKVVWNQDYDTKFCSGTFSF